MTGGDRLRPGTAVTPLRAGLHLRGRRGSVTLEGSTAVPVVWGLLEEPLRAGRLAEFREGLDPGSPLRAAVDTLIGQLAAHDLLVPTPPPASPPASAEPSDPPVPSDPAGAVDPGPPDSAGPSDAAAASDFAGLSDLARLSDPVGHPDIGGPSDSAGVVDPAGAVDSAGPSDLAGPSDPAAASDFAGLSDPARLSDSVGPPDFGGPSDSAGAVDPAGAVNSAGPSDFAGPLGPGGPSDSAGGGDTGGAVDSAVVRWIEATAARPADALAALAAAQVEVLARDPAAPPAAAAVRALEACGLPVTRTPDPGLPGDRVLLTVRGAGRDRAVAAGRGGATGYVTAPGSAAQARADAAALETRLARAAANAAAPRSPGVPGAFAALLAGAAAHRLLCAAAGLPDPAAEGDDPRLLPGIPAVLLADLRPARADHHSWLGPERIDADRRVHLAPPAGLGEALRRITALGEHRCGPLPAPLPGELPQLPVPLATCTLPAPATGTAGPPRTLTGGGPRLDLARLEVFCRAAELLLGETEFTVGADPGHARGRALRHAAARRLAATVPDDRTAVDPARWSDHPQLRHWWTTLTDRLAVTARLEVHRAAPRAHAYRAVVRRTPTGEGHGPGPVLGEAVEATPGDAASFAVLAACTAAVTAASGPSAARPRPSGAALAPLAAAGARTAAWEDLGWTGGWLADLAGREEAFQDTLHRLSAAAGPAAPTPDRAPHPPDPELAGLLRSFGFTVLRTAEEAR
ncbi:hypothetical protein [Streptomyces sp. NPDC005533]|uniref:hypothetical protein n=1 Tax=Streptomyces sp. NPDC005533 TaxID=3364723 RepID=UPI0036B4D04E